MSIGSILITALGIFYEILTFAILIRCIISWLPLDRNNVVVRIVYSLTEPILAPVRRMIERSPLGGGMMIDFSPVIAYFILYFIYRILVTIVYSVFF